MPTRTEGGITAPRGFLAAGIPSGIKRQGLDLALIYSEQSAAAAGVFTTNRMAAPSVCITQGAVRSGEAQAIIANSGNANCCTGPKGFADARQIQKETARLLNLKPESVLVASTGVIGRPLPTRRIVGKLPALVQGLSRQGSAAAARAILTTDLVSKSIAVSIRIQGQSVRLGGIAKGSGMIDPAMATMLCFITTDAAVRLPALRQALWQASDSSFNAITVDGQMSTNDMVLILANGAAGNRPLHPGVDGWNRFVQGLQIITQELARAIVKDGEGATRLFTVRVQGGRSRKEAFAVAKAIANAPLVKTMVAGADPNWGRVAATVGATGLPIDPNRLRIALSGITVFDKGAPVTASRLHLKERFRKPQVSIEVWLGRGRDAVSVLSCDLTQGYVRINAKYS